MRIFTDFSIGDPVASMTLVYWCPGYLFVGIYCRHGLIYFFIILKKMIMMIMSQAIIHLGISSHSSPRYFKKKKVIHSLGKIKIDSCQFSI